MSTYSIVDHGELMAVILSVSELEELEDRLALAQYELEKATGTLETVSHEEVVRQFENGEL